MRGRDAAAAGMVRERERCGLVSVKQAKMTRREGEMQHDEQERERIELARELLPRKERDVEFEWVDCLIWCLLREGQHEDISFDALEKREPAN